MLTLTKPGPNRVDIEFSGCLDADAMREGLDKLLELSEDVSQGTMLYRISNFEIPTAGAIGVELARLPKLFGLLGKFDRCAVLSDTSWLRTAAEVEGALIPGISIKAFPFDAEDEAEAWLALRPAS